MIDPRRYTVGWICALKTEYVAARTFLDDRHQEELEYVSPNDNNDYTLGRMGRHNVVIAVLPLGEYGVSSAAAVARDMLHTFPNIRFGLMVGVGGGAPSAGHDIRLGDVVVSSAHNGQGGVFQYDFGKTIQEQSFQYTGFLNQPPMVLRTAVAGLAATYEMEGHGLEKKIAAALDGNDKLQRCYKQPPRDSDILYRSTVVHDQSKNGNCAALCGDGPSVRVSRDERVNDELVMHYGLIASANQLMKDATIRDKLSRGKGVLCFEMEAAGLMNHFPCLAVRGICDYSDSHKNKDWQGFAAMGAAAYAKALLCRIRPNEVEAERRIADILQDFGEKMDRMHEDIHADRDDRKRKQILDWLTPIDYGPQQSDYLKRRHSGTGQWLIDSQEFDGWLNAKAQTLFCPGIPGAGKTILASVVIESLHQRFYNDPNIGTAYLYCDVRRHHEQKLDDLLASVLKQFAQGLPALPDVVKDLYNRHNNELSVVDSLKSLYDPSGSDEQLFNLPQSLGYGRYKGNKTRPSVKELTKVLAAVMEHNSRNFIVVDALDECPGADSCRERLLSEIFNLQGQCGVNFLATSRPIPEVTNSFRDSAKLAIEAREEDLKRYLEGHLSLWPRPVVRDETLKEQIKEEIVTAADGMFLLAQLYLNSLSDKMTVKAMKELLAQYRRHGKGPRDTQIQEILEEAYKQAMDRIGSQAAGFSTLAKHALSWITCAKRPLKISELRHALAVDLGASIVDAESLPETDDIVSVCGGLVIIDETSDIIRLVHPTAQEYLERSMGLWCPGAHNMIARTCIAYLVYTASEATEADVDSISTSAMERRKSNVLYGYATANWGHHAQVAESQVVEDVMNLLKNGPIVSNWGRDMMAAMFHSSDVTYSPYIRKSTNALHLSACYGQRSVLRHLLEDGYYPDAEDSWQRTPLSYAAQQGHEEVVKVLLATKNVNPDAGDNVGRTALWWATRGGHQEVVKLLLDTNSVDPDSNRVELLPAMTIQASLPLLLLPLFAIVVGVFKSKQESILAVLSLDIVINTANMLILRPMPLTLLTTVLALYTQISLRDLFAGNASQRSPKQEKSAHNNQIERLAYPARADPSCQDAEGRTPLWWAAERGHKGVVNLFSSDSFNDDLEDGKQNTPSRRAQVNEHKPFDELLQQVLTVVAGTALVIVIVILAVIIVLMLLAMVLLPLRALWVLLQISLLSGTWTNLRANTRSTRTVTRYLGVLLTMHLMPYLHSLLSNRLVEPNPDVPMILTLPWRVIQFGARVGFILTLKPALKLGILVMLLVQHFSGLLSLAFKPVAILLSTRALYEVFKETKWAYWPSLKASLLLLLPLLPMMPLLGIFMMCMLFGILVGWAQSMIVPGFKFFLFGSVALYANQRLSLCCQQDLLWNSFWDAARIRGKIASKMMLKMIPGMLGNTSLSITLFLKIGTTALMLRPLWRELHGRGNPAPKLIMCILMPLLLPFWLFWMTSMPRIHFRKIKLWRLMDLVGVLIVVLFFLIMWQGPGLLIARLDAKHGQSSERGVSVWMLMTRWASQHDPMLWLLLQVLASADFWAHIINEERQTPLLIAAAEGHENIVKLLLATGKVRLNFRGPNGQTPLSIAAASGNTDLVGLLLRQGGADVNAKDCQGETALSKAAANGYTAVVRLLLTTGKADPDLIDNFGRTPLWKAAEMGHEPVLRLLTQEPRVDCDHAESSGWTLLWKIAAQRRNPTSLVTLLSDVYLRSKRKRTPLAIAAKRGHARAVQLLLDQPSVRVNNRDHKGRTPLIHAVRQGHEPVVKQLLAREDLDLKLPDAAHMRVALSYAAENGHEAIVKLLLAEDKIDADAQDRDGRTPLSHAAAKGYTPVIRLLLATNKVYLDRKDRGGRTPLSYAAENGHEAAVGLLLAETTAAGDHD